MQQPAQQTQTVCTCTASLVRECEAAANQSRSACGLWRLKADCRRSALAAWLHAWPRPYCSLPATRAAA